MHALRRLIATIGLFLALLPGVQALAEDRIDFEALRYRARNLAAKAYEPRASRVPSWLMQPAFTYDAYRDLRFKPEQAWWKPERLPFQLQFFHPGFVHDKTVQVHELTQRETRLIPFSPELFDYGQSRSKLKAISEDMGFSGFRVHYPLNAPEYLDELVVFQGASYFRALCAKAVYGLSARGLAVDTVDGTGEEFPVFEEFWLERPGPDSKELLIYALLDGPSVAGAYRFLIRPGPRTVIQVKATLFLRRRMASLGLAPLTSMFWYGENSESRHGDFRPEVHDSDGLLIAHGGGEWLWRPLSNPPQVRSASFADENPKGFGLLQRDRAFSNYEDLEAKSQLRPSAWVETIGNWGKGFVRLVEIPTPNETNDNIVAYWQPEFLPAPGEPLTFEYKLLWALDGLRPPAGYTLATRLGRSQTHEVNLQRFVVDFDGPYLHNQSDDPAIEAVISVGPGAKLAHQALQKNHFNRSWRVAFALEPDGSGRPVELRCFLRKTPHVLTETWSYRWNP